MPKNRKKAMSDMIFELENGEIESSSSSDEAVAPNVNTASKGFDQENIIIDGERFVSVDIYEPGTRENSPSTVTSIECDSNSQSTNLAAKLDVNDKTPLISVRFRDKSLSKKYKSDINKYLLQLLKSEECSTNYDSDSEEELLICPADPTEKLDTSDSFDSNLFVLDTTPSSIPIHRDHDVPAYSKKFDVLDNNDHSEKKNVRRPPQRSQECFNCDEQHTLRDCPYPRDIQRINQRRKAMMKPGRYHTEEQDKSGGNEPELVAGRISGALRRALGLQRHQLPQHVYRMRMLGYPPGWLLGAKILHSGISIFDSTGKEVADPEDEDGEIAEEGLKDKYDIKKILDFPGFNIPASSKYTDESELFGCPSMSENDSKVAMLERLAPRRAEAYRRRKLTTPGSAPQKHPQDISAHTDMDIEDDPTHENLSRVPCTHTLSAEMLLLPPPPPPPPLPPADLAPPPPPPNVAPPPPDVPPPPPDIPPPPPPDIPPPPPAEDSSRVPEITEEELTLDDLETRKMLLLAALGENSTVTKSPLNEISIIPTEVSKSPSPVPPEEEAGSTPMETSLMESTGGHLVASSPQTPRLGGVRDSTLGTPIMSSSISKLPADINFAKDICDVINFENLPDSTGKYEKMSVIIKKVRTAVYKIQEENN